MKTNVVVAALFVVGASGCEEKKEATMAPQSRSQAVQATGPAAPTGAQPAAVQTTAAHAPAAIPAERPPLCSDQLGKPAKDAPKAPVARAGAVSSLPEKIPFGAGHWTWVNLWAAWCVPCKEEIPRLRSWEAKTLDERVPLKVAFVSMDDDGRQLETFLGAQPPNGLRSTYWLHDGPERQAWVKEAGMNGEPELPAHVLVDPAGKVRCRLQGAVEDGDFAELVHILRGERGGGSVRNP